MNPEAVRRQIAALRQHPELVEDEEAWLLSLDSETDLTALLRAMERKRREAAAYSDANKRIADEYLARSSRQGRQEEALRERIFKLMQEAGLKEKKLPEATLSIANGQRKVIITNPNELPEWYTKFVIEPNKTKIKDDLKNGIDVPGATLSNAEPHLVVRTK